MALADKSNVFKCKTKCLSGTDANKCHIVMISILFVRQKRLNYLVLT